MTPGSGAAPAAAEPADGEPREASGADGPRKGARAPGPDPGSLSQRQLIGIAFVSHRLAVFALSVLVVFYAAAVLAELVAVRPPGQRDMQSLHCPPTPIRFDLGHGLHVDRLEAVVDDRTLRRTYVTTGEKVGLDVLGIGEPVELLGLVPIRRHLLVTEDPEARFFPLGADRYGRCLFSRIVPGRHAFGNETGVEPELLDLGGGRRLLIAGAGDDGPPPAVNPRTGEEPGTLVELLPPEPGEQTILRVTGLTRRFAVKPVGRRTLAELASEAREHGPLALLRRPTRPFTAVDAVDLEVKRGETLGIVGESGSGKTTLVRCVLRAIEPTAGSCVFLDPAKGPDAAGVDLATLPARDLKPLRTRLQMVFQNPMASLNPRMTVGDVAAEPLLIHGIGTKAERRAQAEAMLGRVGLPPWAMGRYPHAFSGGRRQRVGIARASILRPALVVLDEATSALDVSIRGQVLALLRELQLELGLTYLFVAHDLSLVRSFCDRVMVMRRGRIVEQGSVEDVLEHPEQRYTRELLSAVPVPDPRVPLRPLEPLEAAG